MHVLVTGASGFSGSHLVPALLGKGHRVTAVVGRSRGRLQPNPSMDDRLSVSSMDLSRPDALPTDIDVVVHAAARGPGPGLRVTAADMVRDNVEATERLVRHILNGPARQFIYLSSLSIYGTITRPVVDETTPIVDPDIYGVTKYFGEALLRELGDTLPSLAIRLPGVVGPNSVRNWLTTIAAKARENQEIVYYNPCSPFNNSVHIDQVCAFVTDLLDRELTGHDAVVIGAAGTMSVREVVELVVDGFGSKSELRIDERADKPSFTIDSSRAIQRHSYQPQDIRDIVLRFIAENS